MENVVAVVVTFNRKTLLLKCIEGLLKQTLSLKKIYVIDNASSDGTEEYLRQAGVFEREKISYQRLNRNMGCAGGFCAGLKTAYAEGGDWYWIMDDDAEPMPDALEKMSLACRPGDMAMCPLVTDRADKPDHRHRGWYDFHSSDLTRWTSDEDLSKPIVNVDFCSFVGMMIHRSVIDRIGLPNADVFIYGDDLEYCLRIKNVCQFKLVTESKIIHKQIESTETFEKKKVFGRTSNRIKYEKLWIRYFWFRNDTWLRVRHDPVRGTVYKFFYFLKMLPNIILFDDHKFKRMHFWLAAYLDGVFGIFNNDKPRKILNSE
jgi:rhamnopyranosyl-N-acetylglucosaminyl-diphospho-decaprenol beta-1,3/1,4-galactofuranosyltransferase